MQAPPPNTVTTPIYPTGDTPETSPPDPTALGLSNARSYALQTILLNEDIPTFLSTFNIPIPPTLPDRLDIPRGVSYPSWLRRMLKDPHEDIPPGILETPTTSPLETIYGDQKLDKCFKDPIQTIRLKPSGTYPGTADAISEFLESVGLAGGLLYRGTSRHEARCALREFKPAHIECTDLGEGLYTTRDIELALGYAGPCGVVWVFEFQDYSSLVAGFLGGEAWGYVASGRSYMNENFDVVIGPISEDRGAAGMQGCETKAGPMVQVWDDKEQWLCWRTKEGRDTLVAGLVAMVFLDTGIA